jgi:hypothetical protein
MLQGSKKRGDRGDEHADEDRGVEARVALFGGNRVGAGDVLGAGTFRRPSSRT